MTDFYSESGLNGLGSGSSIGDYITTERTSMDDGKRLLIAGELVDSVNYPLANAIMPSTPKIVTESTYLADMPRNIAAATPLGKVTLSDTGLSESIYYWKPDDSNAQILLLSTGSFLDGGYFNASFSADEQYQYFLFKDASGNYLSMARSDDFGSSFTQARIGTTGHFTCHSAPSSLENTASVVCSADGQTIRVCNAGNTTNDVIYILESTDAGATWNAIYTSTFSSNYGSGIITWGSKLTENDTCYIGNNTGLSTVSYPTLVIDITGLSEINLNNANKPTEITGATGASRMSHDGLRVIYTDSSNRSFDYEASQGHHLIFITDDYGATEWTRLDMDFTLMLREDATITQLQMMAFRFSSLDSRYVYATINQLRTNTVGSADYKTILIYIDTLTSEWVYLSQIGNHNSFATASASYADKVLTTVPSSILDNTEYVIFTEKNAGVLTRYTISIDKFVPRLSSKTKLVVDSL